MNTWTIEELTESLALAIQYGHWDSAKQMMAELTTRISQAQYPDYE